MTHAPEHLLGSSFTHVPKVRLSLTLLVDLRGPSHDAYRTMAVTALLLSSAASPLRRWSPVR